MDAISRASSLKKKLVADSWSRNRRKGSQTPTRWMLMELVEVLCLVTLYHLPPTLLGIGPFDPSSILVHIVGILVNSVIHMKMIN